MASDHRDRQRISRRTLLQGLASAPLLLRPSWFSETSPLLYAPPQAVPFIGPAFSDLRLTPRYPARSPLQDVLRLVPPGSDEYVTEKYAAEIAAILKRWCRGLEAGSSAPIAESLHPAFQSTPFTPAKETVLRSAGGIESVRREFPSLLSLGREQFPTAIAAWLGPDTKVQKAELEITAIEAAAGAPLGVRLEIRYDLVATRADEYREERVGSWQIDWSRPESAGGGEPWKVRRWQAGTETLSRARGRMFVDVTHAALGAVASYGAQMLRGSDYWRTVLDGACGIDVYGNNGVAAGDFDNDGWDDLYVCQPAGLPNRLYHNRGDGTFDDVTEKAGVGVLDNTACALFADFRNSGLQDLLVVCGEGPLLFLNQGNGTFAIKPDAFQFARPPQGSFTHAAVADYDRDGRLDIYFCVYSYYLGLDQYHYPVPYYDARNGPPNFLLHNEGNASFIDRTDASGLNADNDRYSFAAAWGESLANNAPDLYVANDFGRNTFYRNNGDGTFSLASIKAHVEDVGAGMSACWADTENRGLSDIYVANMWSSAGQRVSQQKLFHEKTAPEIRDLYQRHARGNALYRNQGDGAFKNVSVHAGVEMGRWAWCSDFWDFDHDGYADLYVANGYISAPSQSDPDSALHDLGSFFWRQVVARSPDDSTPSLAYEHGWNALNELIRSDNSWSGHERNVCFANNHDGTFSEVSGIVALDFIEDSRSFALADLDHDGRLELILKNRNAPQLRILHNAMQNIGDSIAFCLRGTKSNRDAIGAAVRLETGDLRQMKYLQAGSGFLAQHTKEIFFGLGSSAQAANVRATIRWPSGLTQQFDSLPRNNRITIEEGSASFTAKPFAKPPAAYAQDGAMPSSESLPPKVETWLIDPLKAPDFSLPDLTGTRHSLASLQGSPLLLYFWATASPLSCDQLKRLQDVRGLTPIAVNLDGEQSTVKAKSIASKGSFPFPVLLANEEVAGVYNLIYRYLFDRRRDLPIPSSLLIDANGMIVKVYQGPFEPEQVSKDVQSIPITSAERMRAALPFKGTIYQGTFLRNDFTYGVAMFQHGYLEQAAESFQQVIAAKPNDAEGYYNLGTLNLRRKNFVDARKYLEQTLKLRPNYPEAWNNLGMIAAQEGQTAEAIQSFQQCLKLRPTYAIALLNLGNVYRRQQDFSRAQDCLTRALSLEPDDPETNYSLGMLYAQQGQSEPAANYLKKAVALRPDYSEALNNLGVLYVHQQDYAEAEQQFTTCIRMDPEYEQSYVNLARLYALQNKKEKAREALEALLRLQPQSAAARQGLEALKAVP